MNSRVIKWNDKYKITDNGEVYNLHSKRYLKKQIHNGKQPYYTVKIFNKVSRKYEHFLVHRLVAEAFIPNPKHLDQVNHIDENKKNNKVENLEWCTPLYNIRYGNGIKRSAINRGTSIIGVDEEGNEVQFYSLAEAGRNGFDPSAVLKCCKGIRNHHKGHSWKFTKKMELRR